MSRTTVSPREDSNVGKDFYSPLCLRWEVAAVVLYGDPSFVRGLSWDEGTANNTSFFPRQDNDACQPVAGKRETLPRALPCARPDF